MSWTNYHGHCKYCDGNGEIEDYILQAISNNMPVIGISSHAPVPFDCFWTMKPESLEEYIKDIKNCRNKYSNKIEVLTSLEIDYIPNVTGTNSPLINKVSLDYIIGSIHFVDHFNGGEPWNIDGNVQDFKRGLEEIFNGDIVAAVKRFYQLNREMISTQDIDIIGHFDKIKMHNVDKPLFKENEAWYIEEVEKTLDLIKDKGVIVEINTKSYEKNGLLFPGVEMFPLLFKRSIPVTINSDAHFANKLEVGYSYVAEKLYEAGYRTMREYKNGLWQDIEFNKDGLKW